MRIFIDTSKSPLACLTVSDANFTLQPMQTIFFGDILPLDLVVHDGAGGQPSWINDAQIKVGFGDLKGQQSFLEETCTRSGNIFSTRVDFSGTAFDQATLGIESVGITFEVQASFATGKTETICQQRVALNNQILNQQTVALTAPTRPIDVLVDLVPQPKQPTSVEIDIAPVAPSSVVTASEELLLPEPPSNVVVIVYPLAPSSVTSGLVPYPPTSVVPFAAPLPPSEVSINTKPAAPSSVTGGRLPTQPLQIYIQPEEPTPNILWHPNCANGYDLEFWADAKDTRNQGLRYYGDEKRVSRVTSKEFGLGFDLTQDDSAKQFVYDDFDDCWIAGSGKSLELDNSITVDLEQAENALHFYIVAEGQGTLISGGEAGAGNHSRLILGRGNSLDYCYLNVNALDGSNTKYLEEFNLQSWSPVGRQLIHLIFDPTDKSTKLRINALQRSDKIQQNNNRTTSLPFEFARIGDEWNGKICEILTFSGTSVPYPDVEGYLSHRWQIQSKLPNNHKWKNDYPKSCLHNDPCPTPICFTMDDGQGGQIALEMRPQSYSNIYNGSGFQSIPNYSVGAGFETSTSMVTQNNYPPAQIVTITNRQGGGSITSSKLLVYDEVSGCPKILPLGIYGEEDYFNVEETHGKHIADMLRDQDNKRTRYMTVWGSVCNTSIGKTQWFCDQNSYVVPPLNAPSNPAYCL
jgi:hypothetical protein